MKLFPQESLKLDVWCGLNLFFGDIYWVSGKRPREAYLILAVFEIIHHEGQIAAILGVEKRMKGT